jgi:di/tricarboxylate transporter
MSEPLTALAVFAAIFAVAAVRNVPVGIVMLAAAFGVGALLAGMTLEAVLAGFPVGTMMILAGVTYFFGIARANGTIDRIIDAVLARIGSNVVVLPFAFFGLTASISAMGAPVGVFVTAPIGMPLARNHGIDPMLMGIAIAAGGATGAFAPTGLYGIITYGTTQDAGIALGPLTLFAVAAGANLGMVLVAFLAFGGRALLARRASGAAAAADGFGAGGVAASAASASAPPASAAVPGSAPASLPLARNQIVTIGFIVALLATLVASSVLGLDLDVGVLCFAFGAALAFVDPPAGRAGVMKIDWGTVVLICGIITYVAVLRTTGAVDLLNETANSVEPPVLTALALCVVAGAVSAFASTTGTLAALVTFAVPLAATGAVPAVPFICALAVCACLVDITPFSPNGATLVATSDEAQRPRMTSLLARWGLAMIVLGPLVLGGGLLLLG